MPDSGIGSADHPTFDGGHGFPNQSSRAYSECAGMKGCAASSQRALVASTGASNGRAWVGAGGRSSRTGSGSTAFGWCQKGSIMTRR